MNEINRFCGIVPMRSVIHFAYVVGPRVRRVAALLAVGGLVGLASEMSIGSAMSETPAASSDGTVLSAPSVPCERQTWPYVDSACSHTGGKNIKATRQIRVISTDRNTPATIVTPKPELQEVASPQPATRPEAAPAATEATRDRPPAVQAETAGVPVAAPTSSDANPAAVRTITVQSGSNAASRTDTVFVRVYHLPNGRRITEYSNRPTADATATIGRSRSSERVFVVPAEAGDAYAHAPQ